MVGGDGELDPFAGEGDHAFCEGGVAVAGVGEGVDVGVAGDVAGGVDLAADGQALCGVVAGAEVEFRRGDAPLEAAAGVEGVAAGGEAECRAAGGGVDHAGADGEGAGGFGAEGDEVAFRIDEGEAAGEGLGGFGVGDGDVNGGFVKELFAGFVDQRDVADRDVVGVAGGDGAGDGQLVGAVAEEAGGTGIRLTVALSSGESLAISLPLRRTSQAWRRSRWRRRRVCSAGLARAVKGRRRAAASASAGKSSHSRVGPKRRWWKAGSRVWAVAVAPRDDRMSSSGASDRIIGHPTRIHIPFTAQVSDANRFDCD